VPLGAKPCAVPPLIWLESITSFLAPILLEILIMTDFGRQAYLNGRVTCDETQSACDLRWSHAAGNREEDDTGKNKPRKGKKAAEAA
jgi:hypothetical protein